ncbi:MAG: PfaD family polyunsaturated fatty acid/polyketide biosynthesis protein [Myxococcota bacterium]
MRWDRLAEALSYVGRTIVVTGQGSALEFAEAIPHGADASSIRGWVPPCRLSDLGDRAFCETHGLRYPYIAGAMANGIASAELVEAMGRAQMLGFFGAAGLSPQAIEPVLERLETRLGDRPWGANLIHSPFEAELEEAVARLYVRRGVRRVSASAYLGLTLPIVRYRTAGIHTTPDGQVVAPYRVFAKVSRVEVAEKFLRPPPEAMLAQLVTEGALTPAQAAMAAQVPMADALTVEADSGGHTDNRPALTLVPTMIALRDRIQRELGYPNGPRIGAAGGIATPWSAAAAFAMGADYIVTGSVNQACREAGTSDLVRQLLAQARQADVTMAPAADMFEMGVKLQVLKRGTMFPMRAQRLYDLYRTYDSLEAIPAEERQTLERTLFRDRLESIWEQTEAFWRRRDPSQLERAATHPKHRMALCFRGV